MKKTAKPEPISKWTEAALKKIDKTFPSPRERKHPFVVFTKLLVLAKDAGVNGWKDTGKGKGEKP